MLIIEYSGKKYKISEEELKELKKDSSKPKNVKLQEGWESAVDVIVKFWDNGGKELSFYIAKKLVDKIIKDKKPEN